MQILFSGAVPGPGEKFRGVAATLGILDAESGEILHQCEYQTPSELRAPGQKMQFTGYSFADDRLYVCSHSEIVWFDEWPPNEPAGRVSIPAFNDLHHCIPWKGGLAVANTGLETVDLVSVEGALLGRWDLIEGMPGAREIDPEADYRRIADTKPHLVHGNHLFVREGELWVTQLKKPGAVCLTHEAAELTFEAGMPHDGRPIDGRLAFTTTNGHLVLVDPSTLDVVSHDLVAMTPGAQVLGWCRGLCADWRDPDRYFVGFSFLRKSGWHREYAFWLAYRQKVLPSRIDLYDVSRGERVRSFPVTSERSLVLFQLELLPEHRWI